MGTVIWPSYNDIGNTTGEGSTLSEAYWRAAFKAYSGGHNGVVSGFGVTNPSGLTVRIATGQAIIAGNWAETDAVIDVTAPDDNTWYYYYIYITRDESSNATGIAATSFATISTHNDYCLVARARGNAGAIAAGDLRDEREFSSGTVHGIYTGDGNATQDIDTTFGQGARTPVFVIVSATSGTNNQIISMSHVDAPGQRLSLNGSAVQARVYFVEPTATNLVTYLSGSATWNEAATLIHTSYTTTVTVTGAAIGEPVTVWHSDTTNGLPYHVFTGYVSDADTVTVYAHNVNSTSSFTGTVYARVMKHYVRNLGCVNFLENDSSSVYAPYIIEDGFEVGWGGSAGSLNDNGKIYSYIAFF